VDIIHSLSLLSLHCTEVIQVIEIFSLTDMKKSHGMELDVYDGCSNISVCFWPEIALLRGKGRQIIVIQYPFIQQKIWSF